MAAKDDMEKGQEKSDKIHAEIEKNLTEEEIRIGNIVKSAVASFTENRIPFFLTTDMPVGNGCSMYVNSFWHHHSFNEDGSLSKKSQEFQENHFMGICSAIMEYIPFPLKDAKDFNEATKIIGSIIYREAWKYQDYLKALDLPKA